MAEDLIRYDILAQDALRGVVRKVLSEVARTGLPGDHHFYITILTRAPGVRLSSRLMNDYPEEMTIILQHQFWDLSVSDSAFEVGLSFKGVPERLLVPFTAVKAFIDPSVQFALQFETVVAEEPDAAEGEEAGASGAVPVAAPAFKRPVGPAAETPESAPETESEAPQESGAAVVSLDAFRKKT